MPHVVLACALRDEERRVGLPDERVEVASDRGVYREAGGERDRVADAAGQRLDGLLDALHDPIGRGVIAAVEEQDELVAAVARRDIRGAQARAYRRRDESQRLIAGGVG